MIAASITSKCFHSVVVEAEDRELKISAVRANVAVTSTTYFELTEQQVNNCYLNILNNNLSFCSVIDFYQIIKKDR